MFTFKEVFTVVVRAKFRLIAQKNSEGSIFKDGKWVSGIVTSLEFMPVTASDKNPENKKFWEATPSGKIELNIVNPEAVKEFELLKSYYVDFIPAE
jgi:hypothetical protein